MKVFISYSTSDRKFVEQLANDISKFGIDVWYDKWSLDVGDSLIQKISEGIENSNYMIAIISDNSLSSKWVSFELSTGLLQELEKDQVFVLPAVISGNSEDLPIFLKHKVFADFRLQYKNGLKMLIRKILGSVPPNIFTTTQQRRPDVIEVFSKILKHRKLELQIDVIQKIEDSLGNFSFREICYTKGYYNAEMEMGGTVSSIDNLAELGLIIETKSNWDLISYPKVFEYYGQLTKVGYLIAKACDIIFNKNLDFDQLP